MNRRCFGAALLGILLVTSVSPFQGARAGEEVFTISGIEVDQTAETASSARDMALAEGQSLALGRLFDRIVLASEMSRLPQLRGHEVTELVRDFEVIKEKTSAVRYLATLKVRFKAAQIREFLRDRGIAFAETRSRPVLVLPVYAVAGAYSLWDAPNPWRDAWLAAPPLEGLVPIIRPRGDLQDASLIGAEQAVRGDENRLAAIAQRYGAASVLIAVAGFELGGGDARGGSDGFALKVTAVQIGAGRFQQTRLESYRPRDGESMEQLLGRAVQSIASGVQEQWKRENRLRFDAGNRLEVAVPLRGLGDWLEIRKRLEEITLIRRRDLLYLSRGEARLGIDFIGDEEQLTLALVQHDLILERGPVSWVLRLGVAAPGSGGAGEDRGNRNDGGTAVAPPTQQ